MHRPVSLQALLALRQAHARLQNSSDGPQSSQNSRTTPVRRRSSVVERILGKAEVGSSILPDGTISEDRKRRIAA